MSQTSTPPRPMSTEPATNIDRDAGDRYREGDLARTIERRTAQLPSDAFLLAAGAAAAGSLALMLCGRRSGAMFLGQWVPSILICGVYNKVVKTVGHDRTS